MSVEGQGVTADRKVLTVSELTANIKELLETRFAAFWMQGEVSNLRRQSSGHCYFSLKDRDSQIGAVLFRGAAARQQLELRNGLEVLVYGEINVYPPRGAYQVIVRSVMESGKGCLQEAFERLKQQLASEGLFEAERKKPLPPLPATVGFATSSTGAALHDFISVLQRRGWNGRLIILPARVQGSEAAAELVAAIETAERMEAIELLVIGRGGGSMEDLWAFNEEPLVRAVAACRIPIISAVGHEIDFTLCDFAADWRAETPTAAAEWISSHFVECRNRLEMVQESMKGSVLNRFRQMVGCLELIQGRLQATSPRQTIEQHWLKLDDVTNRLVSSIREQLSAKRQQMTEARSELVALSPLNRLETAQLHLTQVQNRFWHAAQSTLDMFHQRMAMLAKRLHASSIESTLKRGFVLTEDTQGRPVTQKAGIHVDDTLVNCFTDGKVHVTVKKT